MALNLVGTVSLDGSGFSSGLKSIESGAARVGESLKGLALQAFGIYGIEQAIHKTIETADKLVETASRLGLSLEALQEFTFAARQSGSDVDQLTTFIEKLNQTRLDPKHLDVFQRFGISNPGQGDVSGILAQLSANVQSRNPQSFIGDLKEIGGKAAGAEINFLKSNLAELRAEAHRLGVVISAEDAVALHLMSDEMKILSDTILADLAPAIAKLIPLILKFVNAVRAFGTFAGEVEGQAGFKRLLSAFVHPFTVDEGLKKIIADAAKKSGTELTAANAATDAQMAAAIERAKHPQAFPDINPNVPEESRGKGGSIYSDSRLAIGGFLGATSNPLITINEKQLSTLQQIAANTAKTWSQPDEILPPL